MDQVLCRNVWFSLSLFLPSRFYGALLIVVCLLYVAPLGWVLAGLNSVAFLWNKDFHRGWLIPKSWTMSLGWFGGWFFNLLSLSLVFSFVGCEEPASSGPDTDLRGDEWGAGTGQYSGPDPHTHQPGGEITEHCALKKMLWFTVEPATIVSFLFCSSDVLMNLCVCVSQQDLSPGSIEEAEEAEPDDEFKDAIEVNIKQALNI